MRLAMLGGSFNPIHIGHLLLADEVCHRLGYDKVLFVPVNIPPHKELAEGASSQQRLEMIQLAIEGNPRFAVETCELERGGISYTYDTIQYLGKKYGSQLEGKLGLIMGDDLVEGFEEWGHYQELPELADIVLARRICWDGTQRKDFPYPHIELENGILPVSSSQIRAAGAASDGNGSSWRYLVPESVYRYIIERKLYGCTEN